MGAKQEESQFAIVTSVGLDEEQSADRPLDKAPHMRTSYEVAAAVRAFVRSQRENKPHTDSVNQVIFGDFADDTTQEWNHHRVVAVASDGILRRGSAL